jgi:hypothetical protein
MAVKLIVEICRMNKIDTHGASFKPEITKYILGLRPSIKEPLIKKVNTQCGNPPFLPVFDEFDKGPRSRSLGGAMNR